jgi:hypothetical protein
MLTTLEKRKDICNECKETAFRKWLSITGLRDGETTEMKMERPVQSWDQQEEGH